MDINRKYKILTQIVNEKMNLKKELIIYTVVIVKHLMVITLINIHLRNTMLAHKNYWTYVYKKLYAPHNSQNQLIHSI